MVGGTAGDSRVQDPSVDVGELGSDAINRRLCGIQFVGTFASKPCPEDAGYEDVEKVDIISTDRDGGTVLDGPVARLESGELGVEHILHNSAGAGQKRELVALERRKPEARVVQISGVRVEPLAATPESVGANAGGV